jgi:hypothetical protein
MYFGFCNAPSTFQNMMNDILAEEIATGHVVCYIDDILVFNEDLEEHRILVNRILKKLQDNDLFCKPEKCKFEKDKVDFLGLVISKNSMEMDPKKVEGVTQWPAPKTVKHIQAFLGLANFYRRFIKDFAKIVRPLTTLTCKGVQWKWTEEEQYAFDTLKTMFTTAPILQIPNDFHPYRLETDSSDFATGAVLEQQGEDGKWRPVAFYSKSLNVHERNYEIYDKELLAIIRALEEYRHYLEGHPPKSHILPTSTQAHPAPSSLGSILNTVQFYHPPQTRQDNDSRRPSVQEARSWRGGRSR